ncbi:MAG: TrkH family potassium uptake protein [Dethiobacteria bacterium]
MWHRSRPANPERFLAGGFIAVILAGSLLLSLPFAYSGRGHAYVDALFTATSAVCVTGLAVVDTGSFYTLFGQTVVMLLIFIGSLGFMTIATLLHVYLGRRITLRDRLIMREALNLRSMADLGPLVRAVVRMALLFILCGTVLMGLRFIPQMGPARGLFTALFHAVSAFGNAGLDLFGNFESLTRFPTDYLVNGTIAVLFICGGLGFTVVLEVWQRFSRRSRFSLHAKLVLIITALLLAVATLLILALEYDNPQTMEPLSFGEKLFTAFFTAATPRTAGFSVFNPGFHRMPTLIILLALMFIGASPGSTGGGVKTTTFGVVVLALLSMVRGQQELILFERRIARSDIFKAAAVIGGAIALIFTATFLLSLFEKNDFLSLLFETVSAFGTVGLSTGITPALQWPSKLVLIITMFAGRIGPLTMLIALARRQPGKEGLHYPEESVLIG